jgi:hypothetical protein
VKPSCALNVWFKITISKSGLAIGLSSGWNARGDDEGKQDGARAFGTRSHRHGTDVMASRKLAVILSGLIAATTTITCAGAQQATFSESERLGLATCLAKCRDGDSACNNRCISQAQTNGRMWSDDVRVCVRGCRATAQTPDGILRCITGCRLDRMVP